MRLFLRFSLLAGLLSLSGPPAGAAAVTVLSACRDIRQSGIYRLDRDLTGVAASACLRIHDTSDVELDCQGHHVTAEGGVAAIVIQSVKNFTLSSCALPQAAGYSLLVGNSSHGTITKNIFRNVAVYNPDATDMSSLRVVKNRFSEFGTEFPRRADSGEDVGVLPLAPGFNKIEARNLAGVDLSDPRDAAWPRAAFAEAAASPRVYPNPWRADRHGALTFDRLPDGGTLKIFTVSAHWVCTLPVANGSAVWNLRNANGEPVASGQYLFLANPPNGPKAVGQFAVIR